MWTLTAFQSRRVTRASVDVLRRDIQSLCANNQTSDTFPAAQTLSTPKRDPIAPVARVEPLRSLCQARCRIYCQRPVLAGRVSAKQLKAGSAHQSLVHATPAPTSRTCLDDAAALVQQGSGALWPACRREHAGVASIWGTAAMVCCGCLALVKPLKESNGITKLGRLLAHRSALAEALLVTLPHVHCERLALVQSLKTLSQQIDRVMLGVVEETEFFTSPSDAQGLDHSSEAHTTLSSCMTAVINSVAITARFRSNKLLHAVH